MKTSGASRPGSTKTVMNGHDAGGPETTKDARGDTPGSDEDFMRVERTAPLYDINDVVRSRIVWMTFGLIATVIVLGLIALLICAMTGKSSTAIEGFLTGALALLASSATGLIGFYCGRRSMTS